MIYPPRLTETLDPLSPPPSQAIPSLSLPPLPAATTQAPADPRHEFHKATMSPAPVIALSPFSISLYRTSSLSTAPRRSPPPTEQATTTHHPTHTPRPVCKFHNGPSLLALHPSLRSQISIRSPPYLRPPQPLQLAPVSATEARSSARLHCHQYQLAPASKPSLSLARLYIFFVSDF